MHHLFVRTPFFSLKDFAADTKDAKKKKRDRIDPITESVREHGREHFLSRLFESLYEKGYGWKVFAPIANEKTLGALMQYADTEEPPISIPHWQELLKRSGLHAKGGIHVDIDMLTKIASVVLSDQHAALMMRNAFKR